MAWADRDAGWSDALSELALKTTKVEKSFGPVKVLSELDFELEAGEIHALLGVNGAGKSTFIKILSGVYGKDSGEIEVAGRRVEFRGPHDAIKAGIATVQQHPELAPELTGYENVFLGREGRKASLFSRVDRAALKRRGDALLQRFPVEIDLRRTVATMSAVEQEIVAVLQALSREDIAVMILDEPTSTLTEVEKTILFKLMATLKASGIAIVYITHRLEEVMEIADRLSVFRSGRKIATLTAADAKARDLSLAELMLGERVDHLFPPKTTSVANGKPEFSVEGFSLAGAFENVNFDAHIGEILGVFGLVGSGLDELSKALFGVLPADVGKISVGGRVFAATSAISALRNGLFLVPGDRRREGLTLTQSSIFNITLSHLSKASGWVGLLRGRRNKRASAALATRVDLRPANLALPVGRFSGGNQQKVVIAKGFFSDAKVYIFVEPTVGVDIGARVKLYSLMRELAETAVVIIMSTDCSEVHGLADRTFALYKGRQISSPVRDHTRNQLLMAGIMGEAIH
jgi:ribose transport system ATP-binding protein